MAARRCHAPTCSRGATRHRAGDREAAGNEREPHRDRRRSAARGARRRGGLGSAPARGKDLHGRDGKVDERARRARPRRSHAPTARASIRPLRGDRAVARAVRLCDARRKRHLRLRRVILPARIWVQASPAARSGSLSSRGSNRSHPAWSGGEHANAPSSPRPSSIGTRERVVTIWIEETAAQPRPWRAMVVIPTGVRLVWTGNPRRHVPIFEHDTRGGTFMCGSGIPALVECALPACSSNSVAPGGDASTDRRGRASTREATRPAANATTADAADSRTRRPCPAYNTGDGFFVLNGKLYDANGNELPHGGSDRCHYDSNSQPALSHAGPNAVRTFVETNTTVRREAGLA